MGKIIKKLILVVILCGCIVISIFFGLGYFNHLRVTDEISIQEKVEEIKEQPSYVSLDEISDDLLDATVAIEDHRFYRHNGVELCSMVRALLQNIAAGEIVGGGSTITQQLAKNLYYSYDQSYLRKFSEIFTAYALEKELSKDEILELYVNVINYGDNHIGISQAAEGYFDKKPMDLTLDEATLLAGLPQSPSNYQLSDHYEAAKQRQEQVLEAMAKENMITESEINSILK